MSWRKRHKNWLQFLFRQFALECITKPCRVFSFFGKFRMKTLVEESHQIFAHFIMYISVLCRVHLTRFTVNCCYRKSAAFYFPFLSRSMLFRANRPHAIERQRRQKLPWQIPIAQSSNAFSMGAKNQTFIILLFVLCWYLFLKEGKWPSKSSSLCNLLCRDKKQVE
jgi:hypothetical protein